MAFCVKQQYVEALPISLAFSAGVMIYVSFVEILSEALFAFNEELHDHKNAAFLAHLYTSATFFGGIVFGYLLDFVVHAMGYSHSGDASRSPHHVPNESRRVNEMKEIKLSDSSPEVNQEQHAQNGIFDGHSAAVSAEEKQNASPAKDEHSERSVVSESESQQLIKTSLITALAIGLHNFPEGLATFVSTLADPTLGVSIAVAIAIHNIPEGVAVAMPVYFATGSKLKAFGWSLISGIAEPIGGLVGYAIINNLFSHTVFGVLFGFTGGVMVYISFRELLPTARRRDSADRYTTILVFAGFLVMDISLILFELI